MRAGLLLIVFSLFFCSRLSAQVSNEADFKKKFGLADGYLFDGDYYKALPLAKELYEYDTTNANTAYMYGTALLGADPDRKKAIPYLEKAVSEFKALPFKEGDYKERNPPGLAFYNLARAYHFAYRFDDAISDYYNYRSFVDLDDIKTYKEVKRQIEYSENAKLLIEQPVNIKVQSLGSVINSKYEDYSPLISADGNTLVFTSRREGSTGGKLFYDGKYFEDIYVSKKEKGKWTTPRSIGTNINTEGHEASTGLSPDGQEIYLLKDDNGDGNIYVSKLNGTEWSKPEKLGGEVNTTSRETHASISFDKETLYFVSDRKGGIGRKDIYKVSKMPSGGWGMAENLGKTINTEFDEEAPFFSADGKTLIFSSQGHNSMGGYDIFTSENLDGVWSTPQNIGYPINTPEDDVCFVTTPDGRYAYYSTRMEGGMGGKDIYLIELADKKQESLTVMKGAIILENSPEINVNIVVADSRTNAVTGIYKPNKSTGSYIFILQPGAEYTVTYESDGYQSKVEKIVIPQNSGYSEITKAVILDPVVFARESGLAPAEEKKTEGETVVLESKTPENEKLLKDIKDLEAQLKAQEKIEEDRIAADKKKAEADKLEADKKAAAAKAEEERIAAATKKAEDAKLAADKLEADKKAGVAKAEEERIAAEKKKEEDAKLTADKLEADKKAAVAKAEEERIAAEKKKAEDAKLAADKLEADKKAAVAKAEEERIAAEKKKAEDAKLAADKLEADKKAAVAKAEEERIAAEKKKTEADKLEADKKEAAAKAEEVRLAAEKKKAEDAKLAADKLEADKKEAAAKAEEVRLAAEKKKAEDAKLAADKLAAEKKAAAEKAEEVRVAAEKKKEEDAKLAAEKLEAQKKAAASKAEEERLAVEKKKAEDARVAAEKKKAEEDKLAADKLAAEKKAAAKAEEDRIAADAKKEAEAQSIIAGQQKKHFEDSLIERKNEIVKRLEELKQLQAQKLAEEKENKSADELKANQDKQKEAERVAAAQQLAEDKRVAEEAKNNAKLEEIRKAEEKAAELKRKAEEEAAKIKAEAEAKEQAEALANTVSIEELKKMNRELIAENEMLKKQIAELNTKIDQLTYQVTEQNKNYKDLLAKFEEIQKQQKYQTTLNKTDFNTFKEGKPVVLKNIHFDYNLSIIKKESADELEKLYVYMRDNKDVKVEVTGHTDSNGNDDYNVALSKERADALVRYIVRKGIDGSRFKTVGMGEKQPIAVNTNPDGTDNPEGRKLNRRIEIAIIK